MQQNEQEHSGDFFFFFSVPNPLIPLISTHTYTLTRKFRLVIKIQSTRLSSFRTPTVCFMGHTLVETMKTHLLVNCG